MECFEYGYGLIWSMRWMGIGNWRLFSSCDVGEWGQKEDSAFCFYTSMVTQSL